MTPEQEHAIVVHALGLEEYKEVRRLGKEFAERRVDCKDMVTTFDAGEAIVQQNFCSSTNSLSQVEWLSMEAAMPAEERLTHKNLARWMVERASTFGVKQEKEEDEDEEEEDPTLLAMLQGGEEGDEGDGGADDEEEEEKPRPGAPSKKEEEEEDEKEGVIKKDRNWSAVNCSYKESKLAFRGVLSPVAFTNWLWFRVIRPKLEETKSKLPEIAADNTYGIEDVEEIFGEFMPAVKVKKEEKDDKKDKKGKDDKKDKKGSKDEKEDKKGKEKDDKKKKNKKDAVVLNTKEKLQVQHLIKNMIYGQDGANKTITTGWVNMLDLAQKDIPLLTPWEFQIAQVASQCLKLEYTTKKKKEDPNPAAFYEMVQGLADAISTLRKQYKFEFPEHSQEQLLPLMDILALQERFRSGSVGTLKFDMLWYLQHGAHLLAGSNFMKRHRSTVFKPFSIQEQVVDAINAVGPQLVFAIAPPGTGKTAIVAHLLNCFPGHTLVFCCAALPVVLGTGRIANSLGIPYAFVKGRRIVPSYACGRGLGTHTDGLLINDVPVKALESLKYAIVKMNLDRKKKRLAEKKRLRNMHNIKKNPRMYLMCDISSCAWLLRQMDPNRTICVIDEPPMGSDVYPKTPEENSLSCAMIQSMMTTMYKTLWMSATLPRAEALPTLVNAFLDRFLLDHATKNDHVRECYSSELDRGALMCGPTGHVAFPHQKCRTAVDLNKLVIRLPGDPLVMKAYTERALASLLVRWNVLLKEGKLSDAFIKSFVTPEIRFEDLSLLNHASIRAYALEVLQAVATEGSDELTKNFCELRADGSEKNMFPEFSLEEILFGNAYAYPGLSLVAGDDPAGMLLRMSARLMDQMPKASDLEDDMKAQEAATTKQEKYAEEGEVMESSGMKLKFSADLVIQSEAFLKRWCPKRPENSPTIIRILPTVMEYMKIKELPVDERWQMLALSGAGSVDPKLDSDPGNPVYTQWVHDSMTMNKLACVTAGKEFTWGANVPASTVVVTKSFAETTSVAGMLQYVGRAARRGLTTHGQAIFERDEDLDRIFASPSGLSTEALTMEKYAEWWLSGGTKW